MNTDRNDLSYVLITPARNEEAYIRKTIESVITQTLLPQKWIIVSDGSTDSTDDIIREYVPKHPWIELIRMEEQRDRTFAAKVHCFNTGYKNIKSPEYDIIGSLDADISFGKDYFEYLIGKFNNIPKLGVAGTPFVESNSHYDYRFTNIEHVSGACQLFRKECFKEIGGYIPIKSGGIDWVAVTTARMKGWMTRTFTEKTCFHHRSMGTGNNNNKLMIWFAQGRKDYYLGGHPLWEIFRTLYQMKSRPRVLGGTLLLTGYMTSAIKRIERPISDELMKFCRDEQMQRLKRVFLKALKLSDKPGTNHEFEN